MEARHHFERLKSDLRPHIISTGRPARPVSFLHVCVGLKWERVRQIESITQAIRTANRAASTQASDRRCPTHQVSGKSNDEKYRNSGNGGKCGEIRVLPRKLLLAR